MNLKSVSNLMKEDIGDTMALLLAGNPVASISRKVNRLSSRFECLGICYLLTHGDRYKYQENLVRSAHARIFLNQSLNSDNQGTDRHLGLSRSEAIFSALAAGQIKLAQQIVDTSYPHWHRAWEYEDDHCYYLLIHALVSWLSGHGGTDYDPILMRWQTALEGGASTRLDICRALVEQDKDAFLDALLAFIDEHKQWCNVKRLTVVSDNADFWPRQCVSVEALGLLNIAHWLNIAPTTEIECCPASGLCAFQERTFDNLFDELQALI
jgi:hypothetical protein